MFDLFKNIDKEKHESPIELYLDDGTMSGLEYILCIKMNCPFVMCTYLILITLYEKISSFIY